MNFRTTLVLLVALVIVGAWLFFTAGSGDKPKVSKADEKKLLDIESADVTKVVVTPREGTRTVFEKSGEEWRMTEPVNAPAEKWQVDGLVREVVELKKRGQPTDAKAASADVAAPSYRVEITGKGGK